MSASDTPPTVRADALGDDDLDDADRDELIARVEVLREETRRLREEYRRATRTTYRRTALGLVGVGGVAVAAAVLFPAVRDVLVIVGAIGLFGGLLTWYLTPERVLAATVTESTYAAHAAAIDGLAGELGLQDDRVYVPIDAGRTARLFLPLHAEYRVSEDVGDQLFVLGDAERERGVALSPSGGRLYRELLASDVGGDDTSIAEWLPVLGDAIVEQFELATGVQTDVGDGRATISVEGPVPDGLSRPDHPIVSFVGVGLAATVERPVAVANVDENEVTFTWDEESDEAE